jgi:hypothetical protein
MNLFFINLLIKIIIIETNLKNEGNFNFEENNNNPFSLEFNIDSYDESLSNPNKENSDKKYTKVLDYNYFT